MVYDIIINNGLYFDGYKNKATVANLGIAEGLLQTVSKDALNPSENTKTIDATNKWVMPGFIDIHTHYDVEVLVSPGLLESVRHGVTTVVTGSCSLSTIFSNPLDCADMFSRVEALPRKPVLDILEGKKTWESSKGFIDKLESLNLGPNIACLVGHSDLRAFVMGLGASVNSRMMPTKLELKKMAQLLDDALEQGYIGLSTMTNPWDKLDGDRYLSSSLPSSYASWREYAFLNKVLRKQNRILQSAPNLNSKVNVFLFFLESMALPWRPALKTTLLSATDLKASRWVADAYGPITRFLNGLFRARLRWQSLPLPFAIYADGMELVVFEEFGAGRAALHIRDEILRNELLKQEDYRRRFRKDFEKRFSPRIWHRDFHDASIVSCPDETVVGHTIGALADQKNLHPADLFLDLVVAHGPEFRWKTVLANDRPQKLQKLLADPFIHVGFSDAGAHLRNMGFYNFPLHFLKLVQDSQFMPLEDAVSKLTRELAEWCAIDAGVLQEGRRADVAIIDPASLDDTISNYHEEAVAELGGIKRMVRRNDKAVPCTIIGGKIAYQNGQAAQDFGKKPFGQFLRAGTERYLTNP